MSAPIRIGTQGAVTTVTMDAWEYRNALGAPGLREALVDAVKAFEADPAQRVFVLTGANGVFSAGGNLHKLIALRDIDQIHQRLVDGGALMETVLASDKLYIAAVEGPAFGAALGLVASCDFVVASSSARFCAAQIRVGASPDGALFWSLPLRMGRAAARRLLLTGDEIGADDALAMGLADYLADEGGALEKAQKLAARLAGGAPLAQGTVKRFFRTAFADCEAVLDWERRTAAESFASADFVEGATAFLEKRRAVFRGA